MTAGTTKLPDTAEHVTDQQSAGTAAGAPTAVKA